MTERKDIDTAIAELTGVSGVESLTVWVYGRMEWAEHPAFEFTVCRGQATKRVRLMVDQVKRYRDNETQYFLISMPTTIAKILEIEPLILTVAELKRLERSIDTSRPW